jgi:hypothetical protein
MRAFNNIASSISDDNSEEILAQLTALRINFTDENIQSFLFVLLKYGFETKRKAKTTAKVLKKLPGLNTILYQNYKNTVMSLVISFLCSRDVEVAPGINMLEKLYEENFYDLEDVTTYLALYLTGVSQRERIESPFLLFHFIEESKKFIVTENAPRLSEDIIDEVYVTLNAELAQPDVSQEHREVLEKTIAILLTKPESNYDKLDESFKKMMENIKNDQEFISNIIINDYKQAAFYYLMNVKDSTSAVKFACALKKLPVQEHRLIEEIISLNEFNFYQNHAKETSGNYSTDMVLVTARFTAELIFQGFLPVKEGETMRQLALSQKSREVVSESCGNLVHLGLSTRKLFQRADVVEDIEM